MDTGAGTQSPERDRIKWLERTVADLAIRIERLERGGAAAPSRPADPPSAPERPAPAPASARPEPPPRPAPALPSAPLPHRPEPLGPPPLKLPAVNLEDLFGGRILAWVGGVAILIGIALFFALAVSNGWIGEAARVVLAACGCGLLLALGVWLRERRGQPEAALAATGTALAGLFMTVTVAAVVYDLVPALPAFLTAAGVGAAAMVLAVRWRSRSIAALGLVGSLLAPVMVGAPSTATTVALLFTVTVAAAAVLVWQRWDWLAFASFCLATPQWVAWLFETDSQPGIVLALCAFGLAGVLAAVGFELRLPHAGLRGSSSMLFTLNAIVLAAAGYGAFENLGNPSGGRVWLATLALAYLAIGLGGARIERLSHDLRLLVLTLGVLLADIAFSAIASGPVLAAGWAASSVMFAAIVRARRDIPADAVLAQVGLGGHLALAIGHALVNDASPAHVDGDPDATALLVVAMLAATCFTSGRLASGRPQLRIALDLLGLGFVAYVSALALDGPALVAAWSAEAIALGRIAQRRHDPAALAGAFGFLVLAISHALAYEAPLESFLYGAPEMAAAAVALGSIGAASLMLARSHEEGRVALAATGAVTLLYLASVAIVTALESTTGPALLDLDVREQAQAMVSALWSVVGVAALVLGLRRDARELRIGALLLLLATIGKVFLFDLAALTSIYRVISFVALGLMLLLGSFAWQRLRPRT